MNNVCSEYFSRWSIGMDEREIINGDDDELVFNFTCNLCFFLTMK